SVYTPRALPPVEDNEENNIKVLTTKSGTKIILDDTDGEEKILIHTKDGAMRLILDKAKGLSIVNENGDISITCRKLIIEGKDDPDERETEDDEYTLYSTDVNESYKNVQTVKDDMIEGDRFIDLHFTGVRDDMNYTLEISLGKNQGKFNLFENVPLRYLQ
ncbi:MAG: hypothetical protein JXB88_01780, partial [Spirochaetales bacterium]|nr:hypothetical protein [Spirochaetales bacterium]